MCANPTRGKTFFGAVIAIFFGIGILIIIAEIGTRILYPHWSEFYSERFVQLETREGHRSFWIGKPGFDDHFAQNNGDFRHALRINAFGLRNAEPVDAADGRVWMLGDSMTFGWGVERSDSYTGLVASRYGVETYNVGGPGNDVCGYQALADRMPKDLKPRAVVIGLIIENDVSIYDCRKRARSEADQGGRTTESSLQSWISVKFLLTGYSALYNVTAASVKRVPWLLKALTKLGIIARQHDVKNVFGSDETAERIRTTTAEIGRIRDYLPADTPVVVLVVPARFEIRDKHPYFRSLRTGVLKLLAENHVPAIDLYPAFEKAGFSPTHFVHDGHWSPAGHVLAADAISAWLSDNGISANAPVKD
jgi:lysophospholipase L1-like esterase